MGGISRMGQRADDRYILRIIRNYKLLEKPESQGAAARELVTIAASGHDRARLEACIAIPTHIEVQLPRRRHRRTSVPVNQAPRVAIVWQEPQRG